MIQSVPWKKISAPSERRNRIETAAGVGFWILGDLVKPSIVFFFFLQSGDNDLHFHKPLHTTPFWASSPQSVLLQNFGFVSRIFIKIIDPSAVYRFWPDATSFVVPWAFCSYTFLFDAWCCRFFFWKLLLYVCWLY